jgi:hypothetical protein
MPTKNKPVTRTGRPPAPREHGSRKGYAQHLRRGESPCDACKTVENEYQAAMRAQRVAEGRQQPRPYVPRVPKVRTYLDAAVVASFLSGNATDADMKEIRAEMRDALKSAKERYDGDLLKASRAERNGG